MERPEGHDWIGIGLFTFGIFLAAMGAALIANGETAIGVLAITVAVFNNVLIGHELWGELRNRP